jgi:energy-coupling factor transporter ATP-binding protein EcfA2
MNTLNTLENMDPPYTRQILQSKVRSWRSTWTLNPIKNDPSIMPKNWQLATEVNTNMPITEWWINGFIPQGELVLMYGPAGIGKSTFASYLAKLILCRGGKFGVCTTEERFERFILRTATYMNSDEREQYLCNLVNIQNSWFFPKDEGVLEQALTEFHLDVIYFDSIKGNLDLAQSGNPNTWARKALEPLTRIAQKCNTTIIGTFHANRKGEMEGAAELKNVPRFLLETSREDGGQFRLSVEKSNEPIPPYDLVFPAVLQDIISLDGNPWQMKGEDEKITNRKYMVITHHLKSTGAIDPVIAERDAKIWALCQEGKSTRQIGPEVGLGSSRVAEILRRIKKEKEFSLPSTQNTVREEEL